MKKPQKPQGKQTTDTLNQIIYGVLVIENINSNPNGDPDNSGAPRIFPESQTSMLSRASVLRKERDHVHLRTPTFLAICAQLGITPEEIEKNYNIYVESSRTAADYAKEYTKDPKAFYEKYVDARWLSQTLLESGVKGLPKAGGPIFMGMFETLQPVDCFTGTNSRAQGMTPGKDCDIAPNSMRLVRYGVYTGRFGFSPDLAGPCHTKRKDVELFLALLPHIYNFKAANRAGTEVVQMWTLNKPLTLPLSHAKFESIVSPKYVGSNPNLPAVSRKDYKFVTKEEAQAALAKLAHCGEDIIVDVIDLI